MNQTLTSCTFPENLKVIPILFNGEDSYIFKFRPMFLLPSMSNIVEYIILGQLTDNDYVLNTVGSALVILPK